MLSFYCVSVILILSIFFERSFNVAGKFMKKEILYEEAERLGVDLSGLTWPQMQKAVIDAQDSEKASEARSKEILTQITQALKEEAVPGEEITVRVPLDDNDLMERMKGKTLVICPEMAATPIQLFGYEEELGDELEVEEMTFDPMDGSLSTNKDLATGTYKIKGKTGQKVKAKVGLPKEGCGITFRPDVDWFPVCTFQGHTGYLWTHHRLPNVKDALIKSGNYEKYRERFKHEPDIWHSGGKLLACRIDLVHSIMQEIEAEAKKKHEEEKQREAFYQSR